MEKTNTRQVNLVVTDTASLLVSKRLNVLLIIHKVSNRVNLANPHSTSRSDFSAYMTSHVQYTTYKIIACIDRATVLRAIIMHVAHEYKAGEGVLSYSRLTN